MIIYNTSISRNNTTAYNSSTQPLQHKPHLKRPVLQKALTTANKKFLRSLNLKLKSK